MTNRAKLLFALFFFCFMSIHPQIKEIPPVPLSRTLPLYSEPFLVSDLPQATIKGYMKGVEPRKSLRPKIVLVNSITGNWDKFSLPVDSSGNFELKIPIAFPVIAVVTSKFFTPILVSLVPGQTSFLNIDVGTDNSAKVDVGDDLKISTEERTHLCLIGDEILDENVAEKLEAVVSTTDLWQVVKDDLEKAFSYIDSDSVLSARSKSFIKNDLRVFRVYYVNELFVSTLMDKAKSVEELDKKELVEPSLSDFSFLKTINLSDSDVERSQFYSSLIQSVLKNSVFNVLPIDRLSPNEWVADAKTKLASVVGDNQDLFYDLLLANSYSSQLKEGVPFSKEQADNIRAYFKNKGIANILLNESNKVNESLPRAEDGYNYDAGPTVAVPYSK